jgi:glucose-1-phosphate thymidylyltransferase
MYPIILTKKISDIEICGMKLGDLDHPDFRYPWEIMVWLRQTINQNSKIKIQNEKSKFKIYKGQKDVYIGQNVYVDKYVVFDTTDGQIIIDDDTKIESFSYIQGPCYIGQNTEIKPHTQIRKNTSIGHTCKIGGEISGSIFQPFTNKAHHGFIGDSYIGSWVNLGAGTSCSNLKNTYGPIRVNYQNKKIDTGQQFLGCIIGDYAKAAINTSIYTGKIIGVCAQLFGVIDKNVGSFVMDLPDGQKIFELEAAIRMQKRMFERRGIKQDQKDVEVLERVFKGTIGEKISNF